MYRQLVAIYKRSSNTLLLLLLLLLLFVHFVLVYVEGGTLGLNLKKKNEEPSFEGVISLLLKQKS